MDRLTYTYASSPPTNRLQIVDDQVTNATLYGNDIEDQTGVGGVNYVYDGSGNLIRDYQCDTSDQTSALSACFYHCDCNSRCCRLIVSITSNVGLCFLGVRCSLFD